LAFISSAGVLVSTTTLIESASLYICSSTSASYMGFYKIIVLSDGKLAISYLTGAGVPTIAILSSTYSILSTITLTPSGTGPDFGLNNAISMAALTNARFVVVYSDSASNQPTYRIFDSSLTILVSPTQVNANSSTYQPNVAANRSGFSVTWINAAGSVFAQKFFTETTTNAFSGSALTTTSYTGYILGAKALTGPCGHTYAGYLTAAATNFAIRRALVGTNANLDSPNNVAASSLDQTYGATIAMDGYGGVTSFVYYTTSVVRLLYMSSGFGNTSTTQTSLTLSLPSLTYFRMAACSLAGRNIVLLVKNSADFLSYCVVNPASFTSETLVTSGVTTSTAQAISSAKGFSLVGVSSTAAPANGQGTVVINGPAQLSSSYPSTTAGQSFNFQNPATFGVAGSISGRNVNLIGNV
jgi:hypothetical protein